MTLTCKGCGKETCTPPPEMPPEFEGFCPRCAVERMMNGDLPRCSGAGMKRLLQSMLESASLVVELELQESGDSDTEYAVSGTGQFFSHHESSVCAGMDACPIHNPSDHHMIGWPIHIQADLQYPMVARVCPHHAPHPDPDSLAFILRHDADFDSLHGACDGCCKVA